jgi:hypothetical protein
MSSGIGVKGTIGRCYPFYADLRKCVVSDSGISHVVVSIASTHGYHVFVFYIQGIKQADSPGEMCWQENEDYFECLHGFKEKKRILEVAAERQRREKIGESFAIDKS